MDEIKVRRAVRALEAGDVSAFEKIAGERGLTVDELIAVCDGYLGPPPEEEPPPKAG